MNSTIQPLLKPVWLLAWFFCLLLWPLASTASDTGEFLIWNTNIMQAEVLLEQPETTVEELETIRQRLVDQRQKAQAIVDNRSIPLRTLTAQLEALGPVPADGAVESEQMATRRLELQEEIAAANEPLVQAEEIVLQSGVLITELDNSIRQKMARSLIARDPSPLNITHWKPAFSELMDGLRLEKESLQTVFAKPYAREALKNRLPLSLFLFFLGIVTVTLFRSQVMRRLIPRYRAAQEGETINWPAIAINCTQLALPILSAGLFIGGFYLLQLDFVGLKKSFSLLPLVAIFFAVGHWLGQSLFAPGQEEIRIIRVDEQQARVGYRLMFLLGLTLSLLTAWGLIEAGYQFSGAAKAVLTFPIILLGSFVLWRLSIVFTRARDNIRSRAAEITDAEAAIHGPLLLVFGWALRVAAILSTLLIILGFSLLASEILGPMLATVALLGLCFFIFEILTTLLEPLFNRGGAIQDTSPTLLPIFVAFFIGVAVLPLMALNWGMRWTTLVDIWHALNEGLSIGEVRLSLDVIFLLAVVFTIGLVITRWLQKLFRVAILPRTRLDIGGQNALITGIGYTGIAFSTLIAISSAGLNLSSLAIFAGALSVGIGFGLQTIASNFVSGIILLVERPIKEGDWIDVAGYSGYVQKISVRSTRILTFDRHDVIIPNAELIAGVVTNMTLTGTIGRVVVPVGVAYGTDAEELKRLLLEIASRHPMVLAVPQPSVLFMGLGESSIDFELRCFIKDVNSMLSVRSDLYFSIYKTLGEADIEIPFPQRVVTMQRDHDG
jgi:potassium efflux system protein